MALMPLSPRFPGMAGLQNMLRDHTSPEFLPAKARGTPPPNAVPNPNPRPGGLTLGGSGLNALIQASSFNLSAQSLNVSWRSGARQGGGGSLAMLNRMVGAAPGGGGAGPMARLRESLETLGLGDEETRDLMMLAMLLEKLDPEALEKFVKGMEAVARNATGRAAEPAAAPAPAGAPQGQFRLNYVSLSISITEVEARAASGSGGDVVEISARRFELRFERLEISMGHTGQEMQHGDPLVLDVAGDGLDLRETSGGVLFDLAGTGQAVKTAFVRGDDALLFYDANGNGLLDDGSELVGNRVEGLNGFEELGRMDENRDGRVDGSDPAWDSLRLFQDRNGDGRVSPLEVALLEDLGLSALSALWERDEGDDGEGLRRVGAGRFTRDDGSEGLMLDYYFGYRPV